jgi:glycine cleavage system aminomethyltransferase T
MTKDRMQPRQGYTITVGNEPVGVVTSGIFSPTKGTSIAMGYVAASYAKTGTQVEIAIRDRRAVAKVVPKKNLLA